MARAILGLLVVFALAGTAAGGFYLLWQSEGGGHDFEVKFAQSGALEPGSLVIYQDRPVGRVTRLTRQDDSVVVEASVSRDGAALLREQSRFWVADPLGKSLLCFDNPRLAGALTPPGHRYTGLRERPAPDHAPLQRPRPLEAVPEWLVEIRCWAVLRVGDDAYAKERRKAAGFVGRVEPDGEVTVLAPAWVAYSGITYESLECYCEFIPGGTRLCLLQEIDGEFAAFVVPDAGYTGKAAPQHREPLQDTRLQLINLRSELYYADFEAGECAFSGEIDDGLVALMDGRVCGFAMPLERKPREPGCRFIALR